LAILSSLKGVSCKSCVTPITEPLNALEWSL